MKKNFLLAAMCLTSLVLSSCNSSIDDTPQRVPLTQRQLNVTPGYALPSDAEAVDLGLSVKWANMNIPSAFSESARFAWGEIQEKSEFTWGNYEFGGPELFNKYIFDFRGTINDVDPYAILDSHDDAAYVLWGENWRMPTEEEFEELFDESKIKIQVNYKTRTMKLTSKKNANYILLPVDLIQDTEDAYEGYWVSNLGKKYSSFAYFGEPAISYTDSALESYDEFFPLDKDNARYEELKHINAKYVDGITKYYEQQPDVITEKAIRNRFKGRYIRPVQE